MDIPTPEEVRHLFECSMLFGHGELTLDTFLHRYIATRIEPDHYVDYILWALDWAIERQAIHFQGGETPALGITMAKVVRKRMVSGFLPPRTGLEQPRNMRH